MSSGPSAASISSLSKQSIISTALRQPICLTYRNAQFANTALRRFCGSRLHWRFEPCSRTAPFWTRIIARLRGGREDVLRKAFRARQVSVQVKSTLPTLSFPRNGNPEFTSFLDGRRSLSSGRGLCRELGGASQGRKPERCCFFPHPLAGEVT